MTLQSFWKACQRMTAMALMRRRPLTAFQMAQLKRQADDSNGSTAELSLLNLIGVEVPLTQELNAQPSSLQNQRMA